MWDRDGDEPTSSQFLASIPAVCLPTARPLTHIPPHRSSPTLLPTFLIHNATHTTQHTNTRTHAHTSTNPAHPTTPPTHLQLLQLLDELGAQHIHPRGKLLPNLDESGPQLHQTLPQPHRQLRPLGRHRCVGLARLAIRPFLADGPAPDGLVRGQGVLRDGQSSMSSVLALVIHAK